MASLRLEVREFRDRTRWRWVLTDASGAFLADHEVRLKPADWQFEAFADLPFYLRWHAAPDQRAGDEARIVGEVGEWIGAQVIGAVGPALLRTRPAVVRVVVPADALSQGAGTLLLRPLELAHVAGRPLAVQDVTLVMAAGPDARGGTPVGERLRVLGLFSLPDGRRALNLRRERQELVRLIEGIAATGKAADVRVLQYGVTRQALADVLMEGAGWDIVHVSGHGRPGSLLLETASGDGDRVDGAELADLLALGRGRIKLVTVSACWSAAVAAGEQRRLLGLPAASDDGDFRSDADGGAVPEALATGLAERLGCAVLAMRYPVEDGFALAVTERLYELLADKGQPLARAVGMTLHELDSDAAAERAFPALSVATPALFGNTAADLRLAAPARRGPLDYDAGALKMAGFPPQAARFVGRTGVMARASAALAARSGVPGVLLHGMPGGGKTACAIELAYGHEHAFDRLVWYKAPDAGGAAERPAIEGSLTDFALTLERYLPGFQMAHELVTSDRLAAFPPTLTELMERRRVLIVIDNLESLLTDGGAWRDDRWGQVLGALTGHAGLGRVVLTSRRGPVTGVAGLRVEPVDALSADEALLLIRELPHLQALGQGKVAGIDRLASRQLARRAIELAQGHPKLLELAEGQAAHPGRLAALLTAGDQAWKKQGGLPDGFFGDSASIASGDDYLRVLAAWTKSVTDTLLPGVRDLFWFLCCLEERDRIRPVLDDNWADLRTRLGREGDPAGIDGAIGAIAARGLITIRAGDAAAGADEAATVYAVHPGVADAGRDQAGPPFGVAVDAELAVFWATVLLHAAGEEGDGSVDTRLLVRAGLSAAPYLIRQRRWDAVTAMVEQAYNRDPSRANAAALLPAIQLAARHDRDAAGVAALIVQMFDPAAAEAQLRDYLNDAAAAGDYRAVSVAAVRLLNLYVASGQLAEALALADQKIGYGQQAGVGPWTQLSNRVLRLRVLNEMGQSAHVLAEVEQFRGQLGALPAIPGPNEAAPPWLVRELLLDVGRDAARRLDHWDSALDLNADQVTSMHDRHAPATQIASTQFNDYGPLLRLGRSEDALALLVSCRQVFEDAHDTEMLGKVLSALADVENTRVHGDAAVRLEHDALRYRYLAGDVTGIAVSYHNLGDYLRRYSHQPARALASHLVADLICVLTEALGTGELVTGAAIDLRELGAEAAPPRDVSGLGASLADIPGTDLPGLIARLSPDPETAETVLRDLIAQARAMAAEPPPASAEGDG